MVDIESLIVEDINSDTGFVFTSRSRQDEKQAPVMNADFNNVAVNAVAFLKLISSDHNLMYVSPHPAIYSVFIYQPVSKNDWAFKVSHCITKEGGIILEIIQRVGLFYR